jgi:2-dehydropantoate 2-reductase
MIDIIHILGGGAVGAPLAAFLVNAGRSVVLLRSDRNEKISGAKTFVIHVDSGTRNVEIEERFFGKCGALEGWLVIATKAHANVAIARELQRRSFRGPVILLQNGLGVERPFLEAGIQQLIRGVLYVTSQRSGDREFIFRAPGFSRLGLVAGPADLLVRAAALLSVPEMPLIVESELEKWVWRKTIVNAVFNSICTLTECSNRLFVESPEAMRIAEEVVRECGCLALAQGIEWDGKQVLDDIQHISRNSRQLISTLQDVRAGRPTEMSFLNLELARLAALNTPPVAMPLTWCLGELVVIKAQNFRIGVF